MVFFFRPDFFFCPHTFTTTYLHHSDDTYTSRSVNGRPHMRGMGAHYVRVERSVAVSSWKETPLEQVHADLAWDALLRWRTCTSVTQHQPTLATQPEQHRKEGTHVDTGQIIRPRVVLGLLRAAQAKSNEHCPRGLAIVQRVNRLVLLQRLPVGFLGEALRAGRGRCRG